jgi:putative endonuclease
MSCAPGESTVLCYSVYLVSCRDGSLYTGIATDVQRRIAEHESGRRGAKYLRGKAPLTLVFEMPIGDRGLAQRVESRIKRLPRSEKVDLSRLGYLIDRWLIEAEGQ